MEGLKAQAKIAESIGQSQNALIVPSETAGLFGAIASLAKGYETIKRPAVAGGEKSVTDKADT